MRFPSDNQIGVFGVARRLAARLHMRLAVAILIALALSMSTAAQSVQKPRLQPGRILGTVTDVRGQAVIGATVVLTGPEPTYRRTVLTTDRGSFDFDGVKPAVSYQLTITAPGFADWKSPATVLGPGQIKLLGGIALRLATQNVSVHVTYNPEQLATKQLRAQEKQRILGVIPNFLVSYEGENTAPLTTKMKFKLALRVSYDPVSIAGMALIAAGRQAANTPDYGQGWAAYGERFAATSADGFTDIMIGGAILPSLLHEDPRYFYQGTGTTKSRLRHAILSPFIGKRDDGTQGPNYSSLGGDLASSALSNLYYPQANRGVELVFSGFALGTAERMFAGVAQEFVFARFTHRGGHVE
jgi:hypothetical protein